MFVLRVLIRQTTEVSQQKFVQKHSYQHTFSWFPSVLGKSGDAELNGTGTGLGLAGAVTVSEVISECLPTKPNPFPISLLLDSFVTIICVQIYELTDTQRNRAYISVISHQELRSTFNYTLVAHFDDSWRQNRACRAAGQGAHVFCGQSLSISVCWPNWMHLTSAVVSVLLANPCRLRVIWCFADTVVKQTLCISVGVSMYNVGWQLTVTKNQVYGNVSAVE